MPRWNKQYLGVTAIPKSLSDFELEVFFSFSRDELAQLRSRYKPELRVGAALQMGFLKFAGCTMSSLNVVPRRLLAHIGRQLELQAPTIASLRALYKRRRRTLFDHQRWAVQTLGFNELSERQERMLTARLREEARSATSLGHMVDYARGWLFDRRLLIPSTRRLQDLARRALQFVEGQYYTHVVETVPEEVRRRWSEALAGERRPGTRATVEWLHQGGRRGPRKGFEQQLEKVKYLNGLRVHEFPLVDLSVEKQRFYARRFRRRRPSRTDELSEVRRTLEVVSFMRVALFSATDSVLHMTRQRTADIVRTAAQAAEKEDARDALTYREAIRLISELVETDGQGDESLRSRIKEVLSQLKPKVHKSRAAAMREKLIENTGSVRALLHDVTGLVLEGGEDEYTVQAIDVLRDVYQSGDTSLPVDVGLNVRPMWRSEVEAIDRGRALKALEASTLLGLSRGLRRGTIWSRDSIEFRSLDVLLIDPQRWKRERVRNYQRLGVSEVPDEVISSVLQQIDAGLENVERALDEGILSIKGDALSIAPLAAESRPESLPSLREAVLREVGEVQLPELLLAVDSEVHFSRILFGRPLESEREFLSLYGALLGHGTELDASGVALMMPGLSAARILAAMRSLENERLFRRANDEVVAFIRRHPLAEIWGDGSTASADMMSLEVSRHLWRARNDPRRRVAAVGVYQHVMDQWPISFDQPLVLMERQAGAAIEGVVRQTSAEISRLAVDTHGYTDFAMAVAKLLGFDLCPRLRNLREKRLSVPRGARVPKALEPVVDRDVSTALIAKGWDELVRVAASIQDGTTTAVLALQRFGAAAKGDPTHSAGSQYGRLLRTTFLCDYYSNQAFRRELHRVLNRGESLHALERAIYTGRMSPGRGRRFEELQALSGALTLLTNVTMAWTTSRMQAVVDSWEREHPGELSREVLAHIAPIAYGNINFRGTFRFPFERYRHRLMSDPRPRLAVVGGN